MLRLLFSFLPDSHVVALSSCVQRLCWPTIFPGPQSAPKRKKLFNNLVFGITNYRDQSRNQSFTCDVSTLTYVGIGMDGTGVLAPAGARVNAVSTAGLIHGSVTAATARSNFFKDLTGNGGGSNSGSSGSSSAKPPEPSGPKAEEAPGVSAGGQATDKYGNKLRPSGKAQVNTTKSNTREGARNKALNQGSGAVEHRNPTRGERHFHPTDNKGKKKPRSTHHEY